MIEDLPPRPARAATPRRPTAEPRRPYHVGVAIGLSAGVYAASLAGVTLLQVDGDRHLIVDRQPVGDAIVMLGRHHDSMASSIEAARSVYDEAATRYGAVVKAVGSLHAAVDRLGRTVAAIEGTHVSAGSGSVNLPALPGKPSAAKPTAGKPAPTPPPATSGSTGASGKP